MTVAPAEPRRRYSLAEYLDFEDATEGKHEFHDGEVVAMSDCSPEHALIIANAIGTIGNRLKGKPCRLYSSHLRVSGPPRSSAYHPDLTIICGPVEYGNWLIAGTYAGLDAVATLRSVQIELKLTDVYAGVTFPEPAPSPDPREREI